MDSQPEYDARNKVSSEAGWEQWIKTHQWNKGRHQYLTLQIISATVWNSSACKHREGGSVLCYM